MNSGQFSTAYQKAIEYSGLRLVASGRPCPHLHQVNCPGIGRMFFNAVQMALLTGESFCQHEAFCQRRRPDVILLRSDYLLMEAITMRRIALLVTSDFRARETNPLDEGLLCNEENGNHRQRYYQ